MLALVGQPGSFGWPDTCEYMGSANWTQWVTKKISDNLGGHVRVQGGSGRSSGKKWA